MRTVTGPTDRVVVVGAGLAGLSAALHLRGAGREVLVLEQGDGPGGRAGVWEVGGYRFDTGPSVLTMPDLIGQALASVGERLSDRLDLIRLDPTYRAHFPDGSTLDVHPDPAATAAEIERVCGPAEAAGFERFVAFVSRLYEVEMGRFIDRNLDSPRSLLSPQLARLVALGGLRRLAPKVGQYLSDPRTQRLFSFQSMYAGLSPHEALAMYAVIAYLDTVAGVWFPRGGVHAVPAAMAAALTEHGGEIRYGCRVARVEVAGDRARAVVTGAGDRVRADVVVLTADLPVAYRDLLPGVTTPRRVRRLRFSPSCFLLHAGSTAAYRGAAHHNIHFGRAWRRTFAEIGPRGELMSDPSLLVTNPTRTDPSLAPAGGHVYYVLVPTPNTDAGLDWGVLRERYRDEVVARLETVGYRGFGAAVAVERTVTPADWQASGLAAGTPFASSHLFRQTGPFRPSNLAPGLQNVVFAGSGTHPGVGVPMVLVSGRLAAERVTAGDGRRRHAGGRARRERGGTEARAR